MCVLKRPVGNFAAFYSFSSLTAKFSLLIHKVGKTKYPITGKENASCVTK